MSPTTAFLIGVLVGVVVMMIYAWFMWGRKLVDFKAAANACLEQVNALKADKVRLEGEANAMKSTLTQLEETKIRLEGEKTQSEAAALKSQAERSHLEGTVSRLQVEKASLSSDLDRANFDNQKLRERLGGLEEALRQAEMAVKDDLTELPGVDEALAYKMKLAGLGSFMQLGATAPSQVAEILGPDAPVQKLEIVMSARKKANLRTDNLEAIVGVGPVIASQLYEAGIFTFAELAAFDVEKLRALLGDLIQRLSDEESLVEQAKKLAAQG